MTDLVDVPEVPAAVEVDLVVDIAAVPLVLFEADLVKVLRMSLRQLRRVRAEHGPLPPELPRLDRKPRWSRQDVIAFLERRKALAKR